MKFRLASTLCAALFSAGMAQAATTGEDVRTTEATFNKLDTYLDNLVAMAMTNKTTFQQLLDDTRRHLAEAHLLDGHLDLAEISLLLGYSEPSVFFRAFRQWTGLTPGEYRSRQQPD